MRGSGLRNSHISGGLRRPAKGESVHLSGTSGIRGGTACDRDHRMGEGKAVAAGSTFQEAGAPLPPLQAGNLREPRGTRGGTPSFWRTSHTRHPCQAARVAEDVRLALEPATRDSRNWGYYWHGPTSHVMKPRPRRLGDGLGSGSHAELETPPGTGVAPTPEPHPSPESGSRHQSGIGSGSGAVAV